MRDFSKYVRGDLRGQVPLMKTINSDKATPYGQRTTAVQICHIFVITEDGMFSGLITSHFLSNLTVLQ